MIFTSDLSDPEENTIVHVRYLQLWKLSFLIVRQDYFYKFDNIIQSGQNAY